MLINHPVRVLVVDDSAYFRKVIKEMLGRDARIQVVGTAYNGRDAIEKVAELEPDVVTLDLFMDGLDGIDFLNEQMARRPIAVVVCSIASEGGEQAVAAMEAGAIEFVRKPTALALDQIYEIADELVQKVILAASIRKERLPAAVARQSIPVLPSPITRQKKVDAVFIGVSTGGPQALRYLLPHFPAGFPVPIAIVLHMPVGYTGSLAKKLNEVSQLEVLEAVEGLEMQPGRAILAQAGYHLILRPDGDRVVAHLDRFPDQTPHRPAVDMLFRSAAEIYGGRSLGIVLTGMGNDGTMGAAWIKAQGGMVFTEAEETSVIYGMPRSVVEAGLSDKIVPLDQMAETILETI